MCALHLKGKQHLIIQSVQIHALVNSTIMAADNRTQCQLDIQCKSFILWKSQIRHLGNFITHDLSDLNDITYKKGVFISQVKRLNARFPFVSSGVKGHLLQTYCCSFYGCQTWDLYGKHVNQLNVEWNKAVRRTLNLPYKTHRRLLPLVVNGKSFKSQHCSRLHKYVNGFFFFWKYLCFFHWC